MEFVEARNDLCFHNVVWQSMESLLIRIVRMVQNWQINYVPGERKRMSLECYLDFKTKGKKLQADEDFVKILPGQ